MPVMEHPAIRTENLTRTYRIPTKRKAKSPESESPTAFTRVAVEEEDGRNVGLRLALSGKNVPVAQALSPRERGEFAKALEHAIWEARRERG